MDYKTLTAKILDKEHKYFLNNSLCMDSKRKYISYLKKVMRDVLTHQNKHGFKNKKQEIYFFKHVKTLLISKLSFHYYTAHIEENCPKDDFQVTREYYKVIYKYLREKLKEVEKTNNLGVYLRSGSTYLDEQYFTVMRGPFKILVDLKEQNRMKIVQNPRRTQLDRQVSDYLTLQGLIKYMQGKLEFMQDYSYDSSNVLLPCASLPPNKGPSTQSEDKDSDPWTKRFFNSFSLVYSLFKNKSSKDIIVVKDKAKSSNNSMFESLEKPVQSKLYWTGTKVALTELIYALYINGSINKKKLSLKELSDHFSSIFNISLKNIHHNFFRMKNKNSKTPTPFLDSLANRLTDYIEKNKSR